MTASPSDPALEFFNLVAAYSGTGAENDRLHADFTRATWANPLLAAHRKHVEQHQLGFGDPAFHQLWHLLLAASHQRFGAFDALEIGVFKGQVTSLWALLATTHGYVARIHAVTPLVGQPMPAAGWLRSLRYRIDRRFRERVDSGDFYPPEDYEKIVRAHFTHYSLSFDAVRLLRGYSTEPALQAEAAHDRYALLYIDGDHTYEGACADIRSYAPLVTPGGWLIMDDAAHDLPGTTFWKGYESVARACRLLPGLGFKNVINVGHNRVFERVA